MFKGSVTKAGQLLSQYGEYYLPKEINAKLKKLQASTHFLDFKDIVGQVEPAALQNLQINEEPLAAASIGQVHAAKEGDQLFVLKIQYKGIEKAIKGDMLFLRMFFKAMKVVPKGVDADDIFTALEEMLRNEMDYEREVEVMQTYREMLQDDYYYVPKVNLKYSNTKSICMEYLSGRHLSEVDISQFSKDQINKLGEKIFELFLMEVFNFGLIQTDAHGGNFLVNDDLSKLYLLDFGACTKIEEHVLDFYRNFLKASYEKDRERFFSEIQKFIKFSGKDLEYDEDVMWEYILATSEPLRSHTFAWGQTKLPDELVEIGLRLRKTMKFTSLPNHFIFLDRKLLGIFTLLKNLDANFDVKSIFLKYAYPSLAPNTE